MGLNQPVAHDSAKAHEASRLLLQVLPKTARGRRLIFSNSAPWAASQQGMHSAMVPAPPLVLTLSIDPAAQSEFEQQRRRLLSGKPQLASPRIFRSSTRCPAKSCPRSAPCSPRWRPASHPSRSQVPRCAETGPRRCLRARSREAGRRTRPAACGPGCRGSPHRMLRAFAPTL